MLHDILYSFLRSAVLFLLNGQVNFFQSGPILTLIFRYDKTSAKDFLKRLSMILSGVV